MLQSIAVSKFFYMKDSWDSFFFDLGGTPFKWLNREIYSASDINYYAGGWAFRALGYGWESTWYDIAAWKYFTYRRIGEMPGVEFWTTMGYSDCCWRLGWLP